MTTPQTPGGIAATNKKIDQPYQCDHCDKSWPAGTKWAKILGHLGLHGLAKKYFNGNIKAAQERLQQNGWARGDSDTYGRIWHYVSVQEANGNENRR